MNITIPPEALEAGARAIYEVCYRGLLPEDQRREQARAAFLAMLEAWPNMWTAGDTGRNTIEQIILPLPQEASDE